MAKRRMVGVSLPDVEASPLAPTHDEIAARAYELFLARGATTGHEVDDWLAAERELQQRARTYEGV